MLLSDHPRAMGGGVAGALADQVGRQVPIGVERRVADQAGHFRRRHRLFADDDAHRVTDAAILDHPEPRGGGVDQHIAALHRRDRPRPLDIGEDQPLIISRASVERGDGGGVGAAGDGEAMHLLEGAERWGGIGTGREPEALAKLVRPVRGDLHLRQARPARAIDAEAADKAVIGRVASERRAGEVGGRGRGGEGIEQIARVRRGRGEAGIDIAHCIALRCPGAVAGRVEKGLAQHHVGAEPGGTVARADRVERGDHIRAGRQQVEQGLVGAVGPDRLEIPLGVESGERLRRFEGRRYRSGPRPRGRGLGRRAIGRDCPEGESEAGGTQQAGQGSHGSEISHRRPQVQLRDGRDGALSRSGAAQRDSLSFAVRGDMAAR